MLPLKCVIVRVLGLGGKLSSTSSVPFLHLVIRVESSSLQVRWPYSGAAGAPRSLFRVEQCVRANVPSGCRRREREGERERGVRSRPAGAGA